MVIPYCNLKLIRKLINLQYILNYPMLNYIKSNLVIYYLFILMSSGTRKAKPSSSNKSLQKVDDEYYDDKNFTFKITKKRSPWTQEVIKLNIRKMKQ